MNNRLSRLVKNDSGATAIEYGLIAGLIAVVIVSALFAVGGELTATFNEIKSGISGTPAS